MSEKKRYVRVKSIGQGSSYIDEIKNVTLSDLLDGAEAGEDEGYIIHVIEMTEEKYNDLPEFISF